MSSSVIYSSAYEKELHTVLHFAAEIFYSPGTLEHVKFSNHTYNLEKVKNILHFFLGKKVRGIKIFNSSQNGDSYIEVKTLVFTVLATQGLMRHPRARSIYALYIPNNAFEYAVLNEENQVLEQKNEALRHEIEVLKHTNEVLGQGKQDLKTELEVVLENSEQKDRINRKLKQKLELAKKKLELARLVPDSQNITLRQKYIRDAGRLPPSPLGQRSQSWDM